MAPKRKRNFSSRATSSKVPLSADKVTPRKRRGTAMTTTTSTPQASTSPRIPSPEVVTEESNEDEDHTREDEEDEDHTMEGDECEATTTQLDSDVGDGSDSEAETLGRDCAAQEATIRAEFQGWVEDQEVLMGSGKQPYHLTANLGPKDLRMDQGAANIVTKGKRQLKGFHRSLEYYDVFIMYKGVKISIHKHISILITFLLTNLSRSGFQSKPLLDDVLDAVVSPGYINTKSQRPLFTHAFINAIESDTPLYKQIKRIIDNFKTRLKRLFLKVQPYFAGLLEPGKFTIPRHNVILREVINSIICINFYSLLCLTNIYFVLCSWMTRNHLPCAPSACTLCFSVHVWLWASWT